jgi:hypothetical protein
MASVASNAATIRLGQAAPAPNTPTAASRTAMLPRAAFRVQNQATGRPGGAILAVPTSVHKVDVSKLHSGTLMPFDSGGPPRSS